MAAPFPYAGEAAALASSLCWASASIVFRRLRGRVRPAALNLGKNLTAVAAFGILLAATTGAPWPVGLDLASHGWFALSGFVGLTLCDTLLLRAMMEIGPRRATLLMSLAPVLVFAGALLPPFGQAHALARPTTWAGAVMALAGIALSASEAPDGVHDAAARRRGVRDALAAALLQACAVLLAKQGLATGANPVDGAMVRMSAGALGVLVMGAAMRRLPDWRADLTSPGAMRSIAAAAFFGTFLGIGLNQAGLAWSDRTGVVSTINSLAPVWLIPMSSAFLGERHGPRAWTATALALTGVALLSW